LAWSPDDSMLLTCGNDNIVKLWDVENGKCIRTFSKHTDSVTACVWFPDGKHFASGGNDKRIFMMDIEGNEIHTWTNHRPNDLAVTSDGKFLIVICQDRKITIHNIETGEATTIPETEPLTSMELSKDNRHLLVNISSHEIHLWDLHQQRLIQKFKGQKQSRYVIRSCFGGVGQAFVASGSEDSQIYLWHVESGNLLHVLPGHAGTVNAVAWNPHDPFMLASASDDHTLRIWRARPH